MGGQGIGKTAIMAGLSYCFVSYVPSAVGLIAANTYNQLSDSTLKEIFSMWRTMGVSEFTKVNPDGCFVFNKQPPEHFTDHGHTFLNNHNKIYFKNGAVVMLASLDNYEAIEGRTVAWALLDETSDTKEDALRTVITARLRQEGVYIDRSGGFPYSSTGTEPCNPLYVFTKPGRVDWLNTYFKLDDHREEIVKSIYSDTDYFDAMIGNRHVVIASTYHNAKNLPSNYISERLADLTEDEAERLVYGSPFAKSGSEYYSSFSAVKHIGHYPYVSGLPLHISLDFNVKPYMTMQVWQVIPRGQRDEARCIDEYAMKAPKNDIESICDAFRRDYEHLCGPGLFVYGDSSGNSRMPIRSVQNYFNVVKKELSGLVKTSSLRLLRQNPRHNATGKGTIGRREFMNGVFRGKYPVDIKIDQKCKYTIADFENQKEDINGAKSKKKVDVEGEMVEKYGHMSDATDGFVCYNWGKWLKMKQS